MKTRQRGFTLIELMVAMMIALITTTAALGVLLVALETQREGAVRASLSRASEHLVDTLGQDLRHFGVGVPRGYERNDTGVFVIEPPLEAGAQLRPALRIGRADYLAFLGDLPFPNADLGGLATPVVVGAQLTDPPSRIDDRLAVTSELSPCLPPGGSSSSSCRSSEASFIDVGGEDCDRTTLSAPTCPWGLNKWQKLGDGSVPLVISGLDGSWMRRTWDMTRTDEERDRLLIDLDDFSFSFGTQRIDARLFASASVGGGVVAHLDRVFYSLESSDGAAPTCGEDGCTCGDDGCTLWRRHCWGWSIGLTDPDDDDFPRVGAAPIRSSADPADCAPPDLGTPWEEVATGIGHLAFRFYAADGTPLNVPSAALSAARASQTRSIEVELELARTSSSRSRKPPLEQRAARRFYLEHAGGLISSPETPLAEGGCDAAGPANECFPQ